MECLNIPVDHRLRSIIRRIRTLPLDFSSEIGSHVQILRQFGCSLRYGESPHPAAALNFAYDLAGPDTVGGIVIVLEQTSASQQFQDGTVAEVDACNTLRAVKDLVLVTSNHCLTVDDISIFDAIPIIHDKYDIENEVFQSADQTFLEMIAAKKPTVILSCFKTSSNINEMRCLQRLAVGRSCPQQPITIRNVEMHKVNAFHPSYAVNFNPEYSCFRQLLILEFSHAFGVWRNDWKECDWMLDLRQQCRTQAQKLYPGSPGQTQEDKYGSTSWRDRLKPVNKFFQENNFFRTLSFSADDQIYKMIVDSQITWRLCDAGLFLLKAASLYGIDYDLCQETHDEFVSWTSDLWRTDTIDELHQSNVPGMYKPSLLTDHASKLKNPVAQHVHTILVRFIRDMNLTFTRSFEGYRYNMKAQSDALLRFAKSLENVLERMARPVTLEEQINTLHI